MSAEMESTSVQVVVRMRPLNDREKKGNTLPVVTASTEKKEVVVIKGAGNRQQRTTYNFDNVLGTLSSQEEVFQQTIAPVIADVLGGFECTMFAYGQTGTGKTHTMEGDLSDPENQGVIPRAAQAIFDLLSDSRYRDAEVTASYLEIYNEELSDLLIEEGREGKLQICEDTKPRGKGLFVQNLSESTVKTPGDVLGLMQRAQLRRQVGETKMNKQSSRSHCLFTLKVHSKKVVAADGSVMECTGKLHLVDLAGSECAKTAQGDKVDIAKERERKNINQSLLTLGRVISALREGPTGRIPYRDSKLTRLLQESLGGRCKTVIIATVSPSVLAVDETISTLNYAQAAHGIQNKPVATSYLKLGEGDKKRPGTAGGEASTGSGTNVQDWNQMECRLQFLQAELEESQAALSRKHLQQQVIVDRAEAAERERDALAAHLEQAEVELGQAASRNNALLAHLKMTREEVARVQRLVAARADTEGALTSEAGAVLAALSRCVADGERFHGELVRQALDEADRRLKSKAFHASAGDMLKNLGTDLLKYSAEVSVRLKAVVEQSNEVEASSAAQLEAVLVAVAEMEASAAAQAHEARQVMADGVDAAALQLEEMKRASTANGEQLSSVLQMCQEAVSKQMQELQQRVSQSEAALREWSGAATTQLDATQAQLTELLQQHAAATDEDKAASQAHLAAARETLEEQKTSLDAMALDLGAQRELHEEMRAALAGMSDLCVATCAGHVEGARGHAQALAEALEAQRSGQLDESVVDTLEKARVMAAENARSLDELAAAQKASLAEALKQQAAGTINLAHATSIEQARALVESACADHGSQLGAQRHQLAGARDEQRSGNAQVAHTAALHALRNAFVERMDVERAMLGEQKAGLDKAADDLEAEKHDEAKLIETLEREREQLRAMVAAQHAALEDQAQLLAAQKAELAAALAAQKDGQQQMVKAVTAGLEQMLLAQVSQLSSALEKDVSSLVGVNEQVAARTASVKEQAAELDTTSQRLQEQASEQVRAWGAAAAGVQAEVREMSAVNTQLADEVEAVSAVVLEATAALEEQAAAWGKSNEAVEQALVDAISKNDKTAGDVSALNAALDERAQALQAETEQWRASNHAVIDKINSIVSENEALAEAAAVGAAGVDAVQVEAVEQVKVWGKTDRVCQDKMQAVIDSTRALADTMQADQDTLHGRQAASSAQLQQLTVMLQDTQAGVEAHTACNLAVQGRWQDLATHVDTAGAAATERIQALHTLQSAALSEATTSVDGMMAPRPAFLAAVSADGTQLLEGLATAVAGSGELISSHAAKLEAATAEALASGQSTKKSHLDVLGKLDAEAASLGQKAVAAAGLTKQAMAVGPASSVAETGALASELAWLQEAHGQGSKKLSALVGSYCSDVARADDAVGDVPALGSFDTSVSFSSTPADEVVLAAFKPAVDMSDISSPEQQVMPALVASQASLQDGLNDQEVGPDSAQGGGEAADDTAQEEPEALLAHGEGCKGSEAAEVTLQAPAEEAGDGKVEDVGGVMGEKKKRARMATPKKSTGKQAAGSDKPAAKMAATASSRLAAPKARASLRELNH